MKTILLSAKYFAIKEQSLKITLKHLGMALENIEILDETVASLIKNELPDAKISIKSNMKELENNWIEKWESVKEKTVCPVDLNTYFECEEIAGKSLTTINIGP